MLSNATKLARKFEIDLNRERQETDISISDSKVLVDNMNSDTSFEDRYSWGVDANCRENLILSRPNSVYKVCVKGMCDSTKHPFICLSSADLYSSCAELAKQLFPGQKLTAIVFLDLKDHDTIWKSFKAGLVARRMEEEQPKLLLSTCNSKCFNMYAAMKNFEEETQKLQKLPVEERRIAMLQKEA